MEAYQMSNELSLNNVGGVFFPDWNKQLGDSSLKQELFSTDLDQDFELAGAAAKISAGAEINVELINKTHQKDNIGIIQG
jgi:hypothetical protein